MTFAAPQLLWLLLVFPPATLAFFWWAELTRRQLMTQFIQARLLAGLTVGLSPTRRKIRRGCIILALVFVILALARPQWGFSWEETRQRGLDIVVAIDTSKSMLAEDIAPNRLARAKLAALDLMQQAKSDRLGLVAFAGSAFLQCPLTIDDVAFRQSVEALNEKIIPQGGTALAEAIETALTAFKEGDSHKVMVLFTDGEDHDSGAAEAAKKAAEAGLRIFTIGIGSTEGELLRIKDDSGRSDYIRDQDGQVVKSHLNETLLQEIAGATQGFYLPLRGAKTIDTLYQQGLAPLPKSESKERLIKQYQERFHWPLGAAIALLLVEMFLPERSREPKVNPATPTPITGRLGQATLLIVASLLWPTLMFGSASSALREYKSGNYEQSLKDYQHLLQRKGDDPRLHFNAGTAAYRNQQFDEATKQFNESLSSPDLKLQELGYYNRGNTMFHLGERNPDPAKRTEAWEKALKDYQSSLKLNPQDTDAKFNYDFVKKRLEELKQQQQKSQQNNQDQQQNQDQKPEEDQQQQNQQKDQTKNEQNPDSQAQQNPADQKQDSAQQNQEQQKEQQQQQQQQQQKQQQQANEQQQTNSAPAQAKDKKDQKDEKEQQSSAAAAGKMTPQQAQQLLDAQKNDEKLLPIKPQGKQSDRPKPLKDW